MTTPVSRLIKALSLRVYLLTRSTSAQGQKTTSTIAIENR
jgi:hypothetical protein